MFIFDQGSVKGAPSIAAVVGSIDNYFAQYPATLELQETKKEVNPSSIQTFSRSNLTDIQMITNLESSVIARIKAYQAKNGTKLPQRIIVYRDGVSEGQFAIVRAEELPQIKKAIQSFSTAQSRYNPKLTIIICGKRYGNWL